MPAPKVRKLGAQAVCKECGHSWHTVAKDVMCPICKSRHVEVKQDLESVIPYFLGRILWTLDEVNWRLNRIEKKFRR